MDLELSGKTALVTGASQGIGRAIAKALFEEGATVMLVSRTAQTLAQARTAILAGSAPKAATRSAPLRAGPAPELHTVVADLGLGAEVERVAAESLRLLGHVDILVNNAAQSRSGSFFEMSDADLVETVHVKALGYVRLVRALAPHMMERRSGSIINIIGTAGRTPTTDFLAGSMANAALVNFTRGIARELARSNVRINAISPGWTRTERQERSFQMQASARGVAAEEVEERAARVIPTGRLVTAEEVARMTLLLASPVFPSLTGEEIALDGGATPSI